MTSVTEYYFTQRRNGETMTLQEIKNLLDATFVCGEEHCGREILTAGASDMMSDVLAYVREQSVLLTGLCNPQVIRTAEMMDIGCIIFVRGKKPDNAMIELARERDMPVLTTELHMFNACGVLYSHGLIGGCQHDTSTKPAYENEMGGGALA